MPSRTFFSVFIPAMWRRLETLHRVGLRPHLDIPKFTGSVETLVEVEASEYQILSMRRNAAEIVISFPSSTLVQV